MKTSNRWRAANRYLKPTMDVGASVAIGASNNVRLRLTTTDQTVKRTALTVEMTPAEAHEMARGLRRVAKAIQAAVCESEKQP